MTKNTVFITGATSGIGEACARDFAQSGWKVIITGRREEKLKKLASELSAFTSVFYFKMDVSNKQSVINCIENIPDDFKEIEVLINNAGLALGKSPVHESSLEDWDTMIDTNIRGLITVTHLLLPTLIQFGEGATIINIGSVAAHNPYPGGHVYGGTKAFVAQFSQNLRTDLSKYGIRVSNIEPGLTKTEFTLVRMKGDKQVSESHYQDTIPLIAEDISAQALIIAELPPHVNINKIEMMPVSQHWSALNIIRK